MEQVVFFSKCRPQSVDAWEVARECKRVFVGYPVRRHASGREWRLNGTRSIFVDLLDPDWRQLASASVGSSTLKQAAGNRKLATTVGPGSIVLVPRIGRGCCYAAYITAPFELVDQPLWADAYLDRRRAAGLSTEPEINHVGDVVQTWPVDRWIKLSFAALPRWISYRLLDRRTCGIIKDWADPQMSAWKTVDRLLNKPEGTRYQPLRESDLQGVERAMLDWINPASFEHLVVSLLQLEAPDGVYWHHVGGSGDGGADGIAVSESGKLCGVVQCKWRSNHPPMYFVNGLAEGGVNVVVAILSGHQSSPSAIEGGTFWNRRRVAELVLKHRERLPFAQAIGLEADRRPGAERAAAHRGCGAEPG